MKLSSAFLVSWLMGNAQYVLGHPNSNTCEVPEGPYKESCTIITVDLCQYAEKTTCRITAACDPDGKPPYNYTSFNTLMVPAHTTYFNVENNNGSITHPVLDEINKKLEKFKPVECNPCQLPEGSYKDSCIKISITYLDWLAEMSEAPCLFQADCQQDSRINELRHRELHNEAMLPKYVMYKDAKNHNGVVKHPAKQFEVTTEQCFERRSTAAVAMSNKASRFAADSIATTGVVMAGLALAL